MQPELNPGEYVFCTVKDPGGIPTGEILSLFREKEGLTLILEKSRADELGLAYTFVASWISLTVHSSLDAVGLTAAFSQALAQENISCNVIAGYYHDHIFLAPESAHRAMEILKNFSGE